MAKRKTRAGATGAETVALTANRPAQMAAIARSLAGGRATVDSANFLPGYGPVWVAPASPEDTWRVLDLDADALRKYPPHKLLELLVDLSPDVSRALFDFLRFCNPDWSVTAYQIGSLVVHPQAIGAIGQFLDTLAARYTTVDAVWNRLFLNLWMRGALFLELVLDRDGRTPLDLATPDPQSVRFLRRADPLLGQVWALGQIQGLGFVDLSDRPTIRYVPHDPLPGIPYGRPLASSAIFAALFFLGVLHDIRRVVAQQGYPRIDIAIDFEAMQAAMPADAADDPEKFATWVAAAMQQVIDKYKGLEPDDAYVHSSTITVNKPVGAVDADSLGGITGLIAALERALVKGLKTMPLVMGMTDGVSEANANRQTEIYLLGIAAMQRLCATGIEWALELLLRAQGIQADVAFTFAENRATEAMRDEQVLQLKIANANALYDAGYVDQDEAAQHAIGHNSAQAEPRVPRGAGAAAPDGGPGIGLTNGSVKMLPEGVTRFADEARKVGYGAD